jgi:hypothetical protein
MQKKQNNLIASVFLSTSPRTSDTSVSICTNAVSNWLMVVSSWGWFYDTFSAEIYG